MPSIICKTKSTAIDEQQKDHGLTGIQVVSQSIRPPGGGGSDSCNTKPLIATSRRACQLHAIQLSQDHYRDQRHRRTGRRSSADGTPKFLQLMAMVNEYELYVARPPLPIQKVMGAAVGGFARPIGLKQFYLRFS